MSLCPKSGHIRWQFIVFFCENTGRFATLLSNQSSFLWKFITFTPKLKRINMEERKLNRLKVVLAEKDKTGRWLSEQIGKRNRTVSKYINQKVQPDLKTLDQIARVLGVNVKDLLNDTEI